VFGTTEFIPSITPTFSNTDHLTVLYQICNYGAPDSELTSEYRFYRIDGGRKLFNGTKPETYTDADLPRSDPFEPQALAIQKLPLDSFPAGRYEIEISVHDRLRRADAKAVAPFVVR
jgi:hypothetical protein